MKRNITAVPKETINLTNIADFNANRAETIMNTTSELCGSRLAVIPMDLYDVDYSYQRVVTANINYLTKEFDLELCDPLRASYRDGKFFIVDGQHRYYAAVANGVEKLLCIVHTGLTDKDEARLFVRLNTFRKTLKPIDTFRANIICGNEDIPEVKRDMIIKRVCDAHNIEITEDNRKAKERRLRALTTARTIVSLYGEDGLNWIFNTMKGTDWYNDGDSYRDCVLAALKTYYGDNINNLDKAQGNLHQMMIVVTPQDLIAKGKDKERKARCGRYAGLSMALTELLQNR